eukprot:190204-Chlamydomonas_euryale.AAC.7
MAHCVKLLPNREHIQHARMAHTHWHGCNSVEHIHTLYMECAFMWNACGACVEHISAFKPHSFAAAESHAFCMVFEVRLCYTLKSYAFCRDFEMHLCYTFNAQSLRVEASASSSTLPHTCDTNQPSSYLPRPHTFHALRTHTQAQLLASLITFSSSALPHTCRTPTLAPSPHLPHLPHTHAPHTSCTPHNLHAHLPASSTTTSSSASLHPHSTSRPALSHRAVPSRRPDAAWIRISGVTVDDVTTTRRRSSRTSAMGPPYGAPVERRDSRTTPPWSHTMSWSNSRA